MDTREMITVHVPPGSADNPLSRGIGYARKPTMRPNPPNPFDRSLKVLIRRVLPVLLRLAGVEVDPAQVHPDDTAINLPEHHADHLFRIGEEGDPTRWALHLEYQLQPDPRVLPDWFYKNAALNKLLECPVILMAVYLT